jgi:hypothetical protein
MATVNVTIGRTVTSAVGAQVNGEPVRANGGQVTVQIVAPAAVGRIEQSNDAVNWIVATQEATDLTTLDDGVFVLHDLPEWVRPATIADAGGPRALEFIFSVQKES